MLPVGSNTKSSACATVSSNCVIWHGADIPCAGLCKGDSVTDVILKLGDLVCDIDARAGDVNVNTTCLGSGDVTWATYNDLIQYLTDKLCDLYTVVDGIVIPPSPNLTANVAACLQSLAGGTTLGVVAYTELIGNQLCNVITDVSTLQSTVSTHTTQISNINITLAALPTTYAPINSTYVCLSSGVDTLVNIVATIEQELCDLEAQTGTPVQLAAQIQPYCNITNEPALSLPGTMASAYPEWNVTVSNLADSIRNLWITVCDIRNFMDSIAECCTKTCADIILGFYGELNATTLSVRSLSGSSLPSQFIQCTTPSSTITVTDGLGASYTTNFNNIASVVAGGVLDIDLSASGLNLSTDFVVSVTYCFTNADTALTCQNTVTFNVINTVSCPVLNVSGTWDPFSSTGGIAYDFNNVYIASSLIKYRVRAYDATTTLVGNVTTAVASTIPNPVTGNFTGFAAGSYTVEVAIVSVDPTTGTETVTKTCPAQSVIVSNTSCNPPTNLTAWTIN